MNIDEIIRSRHSVRSYLDKSIEKDKLDILNELIKEINIDNKLHIQLIIDDPRVFDKFILHYGRLKNAKNYIALIGKEGSDLDELCGYYGEKIVLKAQELGLNTCWVAGSYSRKSVKAEILDKEKLVCVIAIGYGEGSGNNRKSKTFDEVSLTKDVPEWYKKGVEYALLAPTAMNGQKFKFELVDNNKVSIKVERGPMTKIDKGIVKYHFELGAGLDNFSWL